jgi:hypothetical protein
MLQILDYIVFVYIKDVLPNSLVSKPRPVEYRVCVAVG